MLGKMSNVTIPPRLPLRFLGSATKLPSPLRHQLIKFFHHSFLSTWQTAAINESKPIKFLCIPLFHLYRIRIDHIEFIMNRDTWIECRVILICFKNFSNFSCEKRKVEKVFLVVDFLLYSLTFELQQKEESREDYRGKWFTMRDIKI